jgi:simple sugar transport system permease protein
VVDIGLEGKLIVAAFAGAAAAALSGDAWIGCAAAVAASVALALLQGFVAIDLAGSQIVAGMGVNMIAAGATSLVGAALFGEGGRTPPLAGAARLEPIASHVAAWLGGTPLIGPFARALAGQNVITCGALLAVAGTSFVLTQTRFGLRLRAAGENPHALAAAGVPVRGIRYRAVLICGVLCGFGGADLALAQVAGFLPGMSAGKGFIALAALIFAKWRPGMALATCLLFSGLDAAAIRLQGMEGIGMIPVQALQSVPYVLTVVLLAGFVGRAVAPAASGIPYVRGK